MTRLVIISDELKGGYKIVAGDERSRLVLTKTVNRKNAGFSKFMDIQLPITQTESPAFGQIAANIELTIDVNSPRLEELIALRQAQLVQSIASRGAATIRGGIERVASEVLRRAMRPGVTPYDLTMALTVSWPRIMDETRQLLSYAMTGPNAPFLSLRLTDSLNTVPFVQAMVADDTARRSNLIEKVVTRKLDGPWHPAELAEAVREHMQLMMQQWPLSLSPALTDPESLLGVVESYRADLSKNLHILGLGNR